MPRLRVFTLLLAGLSLPAAPVRAQKQMEYLTRGAVAVKNDDGSVFVSWRLLGTDAPDAAFDVYRRAGGGDAVKINAEPLAGATNIVDDAAPADAPADANVEYSVRLAGADENAAADSYVALWEKNYLEIPIKPLEGYRPGDASTGDLDGDGQLDVVIHQAGRGQDNSFPGVTSEPVLDAYTMAGKHLWRINLGKNIREGEHYTQFMVYDLDGDGRAEVACKTADGTTDGVGKTIGDAEKDWRTMNRRSRRDGRILDGPEYLTIFDGLTGAALKTVDYIPSRYPIDGWGGIGGNASNDDYGNRCDRHLACVAYLDGSRPSLVMCRGVYGRIVMAAWDWRDGDLTVRWVFDTGMSYPPFENASPFSGMGGHSLAVADVDDDGKDEIVYQAMVVDDNGKGLYSSGLRHGDAMFVTDMYPDRPGMEVFTVQENEENAELYQTPGAAMRDARTGEILWSHSPVVDIGGGMAADIDPRHPGFEAWGGPGGLRDAQGKTIGRAPRETGWTIWWDGDPLRELLSVGRGGGRFGGRGRGRRVQATRVDKWNPTDDRAETIAELDGVSFSRGPCLQGDLIGDWREELLLAAPDGQSLRLYTTTVPTDIRLTTLLHDSQYRLGLAWQNVVYNKPCYPSFYVGDGMAPPPRPNIVIAKRGNNEAASNGGTDNDSDR